MSLMLLSCLCMCLSACHSSRCGSACWSVGQLHASGSVPPAYQSSFDICAHYDDFQFLQALVPNTSPLSAETSNHLFNKAETSSSRRRPCALQGMHAVVSNCCARQLSCACGAEKACTCRSKFAVKESQSLAKIPDTLVFAMEFINLPVPNDQATGLEELRKTVLRLHPDLKVGPARAAYMQRQCKCFD